MSNNQTIPSKSIELMDFSSDDGKENGNQRRADRDIVYMGTTISNKDHTDDRMPEKALLELTPTTSDPSSALKKTCRSTRKHNNNGECPTPSKKRCLPALTEEEESLMPISKDVASVTSPEPAPNVTFSTPFWLGRLPYTSTPIGLTHTPFHIKPPVKRGVSEIMSRLNIREETDFPECAAPSVQIKRKNDEVAAPKYLDLVKSSGDNLEKLDDRFHATLEEYRGPMPDKDYEESEEREEAMWSSEELESQFRHSPTNTENMYDAINDDYIFAVWRQFEGHIPTEIALQHLQRCKFDILEALESVDQLLKTLPQKLKPLCTAQVQLFHQEQKKSGDGIDLRSIQDNVMRNYHLPEVHNFFYGFRRFFGVDNDPREGKGSGGLTGKAGCNCNEPMCRELDFEPRFGCSNCTKTLRKSRLPADKRCLICKTYTKISGKPRPAENPVFDEEDLEKIRLWDSEESNGKSREEFEKWHQEQKNMKWRALDITKEESLMLNYSKLKLAGKHTLGEQVCSMLQPYLLPHFAHCQCSKSGGIPNRTKNFGKSEFSLEEVDLFRQAVARTPGDIETAAKSLGVEEELFEVFLNKYKARSEIWMNLPRNVKVHNYEPRTVLPPINGPPAIPKIGSVQK